MKVIYYYQTFVGLYKMLSHIKDLDVMIISSIHFGEKNNKPYIHLNDNNPTDSKFNQLWLDMEKAQSLGIKIVLMVGGAGGAYQELFSNFEVYYKLLKNLLEEKTWINGIDLDIEESVKLEDVQMLMDRLKKDFGEDFILTMAPVASSLQQDGSSMGGFDYKKLYQSNQGKYINWFNTQCYNSFSVDTYKSIINNGYPPEKIVMGMESGQFNKDTFKNALYIIKELLKIYPTLCGIDDWEYCNAPPNKEDPSLWAKLIKEI